MIGVAMALLAGAIVLSVSTMLIDLFEGMDDQEWWARRGRLR